MRFLWALVKVAFILAVGIPLAIIALSVSLGVLGALVGLAVLALRLAVVGLVIYGVVRLGMSLLGRKESPKSSRPAELASPADPYYEAARRELDREIPEAR